MHPVEGQPGLEASAKMVWARAYTASARQSVAVDFCTNPSWLKPQQGRLDGFKTDILECSQAHSFNKFSHIFHLVVLKFSQ